MKRHYYARSFKYGINTTSTGDKLHAFTSTRARDEWINEEWNRRAAVTRDKARHLYPDAFRPNCHCFGSWESWWTDHVEWSGAPTGGAYEDLND